MARRGSNDDAEEDSYGEESVSDDAEGGLESELQTEAEVTCPFCGESMAIVLDAGGGTTQEYVEDCQVCCRPWQVHVSYDKSGAAEVWLAESA